jgi:6-phosphogluconolactonase
MLCAELQTFGLAAFEISSLTLSKYCVKEVLSMPTASTLRQKMTALPAPVEIAMEVLPTVASVAQIAAEIIAADARVAIAERGRFVLAVSGGHTPWLMLRALAKSKLPWTALHIVQVDERIAPSSNPDRNLVHLRESLLTRSPLPSENLYGMPVEAADLETAARQYGQTIGQIAGMPPMLDLIHLGLGADGHTASLVPGDPVLDVADRDVALTNTYEGRRRMTLTYPIINRARRILWVVTGREKASVLNRFLRGDPSLPSSLVSRGRATLIADHEAASVIMSASTD